MPRGGATSLQPKASSLSPAVSSLTHRLLAEHLTSEYRVKTEGRGRTVDEWKLRVDGLDNHWLDCLAGCAVAASMGGASPPGLVGDAPKPRPTVRLSQIRRDRR